MAPAARSGHSSDVHEGHLVLFGGIYDVTKEMNDINLYSFEKNEWVCL